MGTRPSAVIARDSRTIRARWVTVAVATAFAIGLPMTGSAGARERGTYVLQQASRGRELRRIETEIDRALRFDGVLGFSLRVPWSALERERGVYDFRILRLARRIAGDHQLTVRFMAGRYTPRWRMGHSMTYDGSATGGLGKGAEVPLTFARGGGPNLRFERGWKRIVERLARWCRNHDVRLLHVSWPGLLWAELALVDQMTRQRGYSYGVVRKMHLRMMNYALRQTTRHLDVGFTITGHAPHRLFADIHGYLLAHRLVSRALLQSNNLSEHWSGSTDPPPPRRGAQVYGGGNAYTWSVIYEKARLMHAEYVEVYTSSFSGGTSDLLRTEVGQYYRSS